MPEERARILDMLREGKITVDEAERLLDALGPTGGRGATGGGLPPPPPPPPGPGSICIRITDTDTGKIKTNVRIPLIAWGLLGKFTKTRIGQRLKAYGFDLGKWDLRKASHAGSEGQLVDVVDDETGERVEVFFE